MSNNPPNFKPTQNHISRDAWHTTMLARLQVPWETRMIDTRFGKTHLLVAGATDTPPILLLHGAASHASGCWPLINGLAGQYQIFAPDAPGHLGKSEPFRLSSRGDDYGKWLIDILDSFGIQQTSLIGFSFGGWMALKLACYSPERISSIVLMSPIGVAPFRIQYLLRSPILLIKNLIHPCDENMEALARLFAGPTASDSIIEEVKEAGKVFLRNFHMIDIPFRFSSRDLKRLQIPTLALMGEHDTFFKPRSVVSRLCDHMPKVQTSILPQTGHIIFFERPELVNHHIREFLSDL